MRAVSGKETVRGTVFSEQVRRRVLNAKRSVVKQGGLLTSMLLLLVRLQTHKQR